MANTDIPNALEKIEKRTKDVPWYNHEIGSKLGDSARDLLENYSHIPPAEVESHVYAVVSINVPSFESHYRLDCILKNADVPSAMKPGRSGRIPVLANSASSTSGLLSTQIMLRF
jgi:hypothetical protein